MSKWTNDQQHCTGCALAVLLGFLLLGLCLSPTSPFQTPKDGGDAPPNSATNNEKEPPSVWHPSTWDPTATFTLVLAIGTIALAFVSWKAANAAKTSTELARDDIVSNIAAERAHFYPVITSHNLKNQINVADNYARQSPTSPTLSDIKIHYRLKNYGKSPAIYLQNAHDVFLSAPPPEPVFTVSEEIPEHHMIEAGAETDVQTVGKTGVTMLNAEWIEVLDGTKFIWFAGNIDYLDIFGKRHTDRFLFRYIRLGGRFRFQPYDYKHYNQSS